MENKIELFLKLIKSNIHININNIYINDYYNLKLIYTTNLYENLHHSNDIIDYIIHNIDFIITDNEYNIITYVAKNLFINSSIKDELNNNWDKCYVYYNYIGLYTIFFIHNNIKYYCIKYKIDKFTNSPFNFIDDNIFNDYTKPIHKIICYNKLKFILSYDSSFNIINKKIYDLDKQELKFNSYEDLEDLHFKNINLSEKNKKLNNAGFIIIYNNYKYLLLNKIYEKITDILPKYNNINKIYLDLYKNDNLNKIINYLTPYSYDILKRINYSMKTIAKEYLNIYHLTRKKSNPVLYDKMTNANKKILYELHTIFINTRKHEYLTNEYFIDKKSLNVDIVYKYLKKLNIEQLEQIFIERDSLIENTKNILSDKNFKIFFEDCINSKTMSYLLKK